MTNDEADHINCVALIYVFVDPCITVTYNLPSKLSELFSTTKLHANLRDHLRYSLDNKLYSLGGAAAEMPSSDHNTAGSNPQAYCIFLQKGNFDAFRFPEISQAG